MKISFNGCFRIFTKSGRPSRPSILEEKTKDVQSQSDNQLSWLVNDLYDATEALSSYNNDSARQKGLAVAKKLVAALEKPEEVVFRQAFEVSSPERLSPLDIDGIR